ncbi:uncharacterized protein LOC111042172, partial [Myzus persicae]|uniref:uncharacterized protein LOC111042172 n=1 Tax=Myzus persicae TaxID=13164 RepID=UPI000B92FD91
MSDEPQASELNELIQSPEIQINEKTVDNLNTGKIDLKSNSILCTNTNDSNIPENDNNYKEENEQNLLNLTLTNPTDRAHFDEEVENSDIKRSIISFGPCKPVIEFPKNNEGRKLSSNFYFVSARSGSKIPRSWLCYSTVLDKAYCESCWLFANRKSTSFKSEWINGIDDWKHLSQSIQRHEISIQHLESTNMRIIWVKNRTIDKELEIQYSKEATFWRNILL